MNEIAVFTGSLTIYWSAIIICLGIAAGLCLTLALYPMDHRHNTAVWVWFPITTVLSVLLSRLIHWYSHIEQYSSLLEAMTDYSSGGYCVQGIILGAVFAALLVKLVRLTPTAGELLDAAAPGLALCLALIRLSSLFNTNCRGRIVITDRLFQHLPYAISWTDAAGNVEYDPLRVLLPASFGAALGRLAQRRKRDVALPDPAGAGGVHRGLHAL